MSDQKVALVTGANRGLGLEVCRQLAKAGCKVFLSARDLKKGVEAASLLQQEGFAVESVVIDVTDPVSISKVRDQINAACGRLDILVNNAGILPDNIKPGLFEDRSLLETPLETFEHAMQTNAFGAIQVCQSFVPLMKGSGSGRIVNVSSQVAQLSTMDSGIPAYRLSKVALNAVTRILADELRPLGILCNSVSPGWVRTDMGGPEANLTVEEGAVEIVRLALLPDDGPTGQFFRLGQVIEW
jgi:NAD(P)-dependent dehydrogenase (short-subunit alcohol dehydrogenase family)